MAPVTDPAELQRLERDLDRAMIRDARRLRARIRAMRQRIERRQPVERSLAKIQRDLEQSIARRAARRASLPATSYPESLPVAQRKDELARAIEENQVVVICGETGSGKTTQLPKICLELGRGAAGMIGHTQPRRIAARAVASRISEELGVSLGGVVGYKVRFNAKAGDRTLVKLMTDGILLAETQGDRWLERYDTIIIDEAHERSLNIDFLLGYLKELLPRRPELKVIITSATIDPERFANHFASADEQPAPIIQVSGRTYPVDLRYRPIESDDEPDEDSPEMQDAIVDAIAELSRQPGAKGDVLIFLSGEREIRATAETLKKQNLPRTEILPLFARLTIEEQRKVFAPHRGRRIVLATNVAETSLTVPGITGVIDPGCARISRYSARKQVQGLQIESISRASANQRAGRCGRVAPGVCIRLYSREDFDKREEFTPPEILRTNLAAVILQMKALGLGSIDRFPFLERPSDRAIAAGYETLYEIGAVDGLDPDAKLTDIGRQLARLPIDPRIGRMVLAGESEGVLGEVLIIASALSSQDPRVRPFDQQKEADAAHAQFVVKGGELSDFMCYVALWDAYHKQKKRLSHRKLASWCKQQFVSAVRMREWIEIERQLRELAGELELGSTARAKDQILTEEAAPPRSFRHPLYQPIHQALLAGLITSVGVRGDRHEYAGPRGVRFNLFPGSNLFEESPKWVMGGELVRTTKLYARTAAKIQPKWIERAAQHLIKSTWTEPHWDERTAQVWGYERVALLGLELVPRRHRHYGPHAPTIARQIFIQRGLVDGRFWTTARFAKHNRALLERVEEIQARTRRHDLLASVEAQFDFYDARVPRDIYTGRAFDEWIRREQKRDSDALCMSESDLMPDGAERLDAELYPPAIRIAGAELPVEYHFEPGATNDGVTVSVPIEALPSVPRKRIDWLVPGMLQEKVVALIRTLPKEIRRQLGPASEIASRCIRNLDESSDSLHEALARELSRLSGLDVAPDDFKPDELADHLRFNLRVHESGGPAPAVLAEGRDVEAIKAGLRQKIEEAHSRAPDERWSRKGLRSWEFEDLPESIEQEAGGVRTRRYVTLAPSHTEPIGADIRLCATKARAGRLHRLGLRRLFVAEAGAQIRFLLEHLPAWDRLVILHSTMGDSKALGTVLEALVSERAFLGEGADIRTRAGFEAQLDRGWHRIGQSADQVVGLVEEILKERQSLQLQLEGDHPAWRESAVRSLEHQLAHLLPKGALLDTPLANLQEFPRYLEAASKRLVKLAARGSERDAQLQLAVNRFWDQYAMLAAALSPEDARWPALIEFRWMIEELRVSFFAQQLGTSRPVSEARMKAMWGEIARQSS